MLGRCLEHLFAQDHANYEVIVVDDGSRDGTSAIAEAAAAEHPLTLLRSARNRGCPAARNLGLERARGEIVAFIDDDGFAASDWLRRVCEPFEGDPSVGAVASTVFYGDNPLVLNGAGGTVNRQGWAADLSMNRSYEDAEIATEALYPMGCGMAISRLALERVGPFDDRMHNYYDDVDYGIRVWRAGLRVVVAADAWVDHGVAGGALASGAPGDGTPLGGGAPPERAGSGRRPLLCERHRARVVLKHAPASELRAWSGHELHSARRASPTVRGRKLRALAWNVAHLPSVLAYRRAHAGARAVPERLLEDSWGDAFPAGVPPRVHPQPELAGELLDASGQAADGLLPYGWFPPEGSDGRSYRWATTRAAALVRLERPVRLVRLDFRHVPVDLGGVEVELRSLGSADPAETVWRTRLGWQYIARSVRTTRWSFPRATTNCCSAPLADGRTHRPRPARWRSRWRASRSSSTSSCRPADWTWPTRTSRGSS